MHFVIRMVLSGFVLLCLATPLSPSFAEGSTGSYQASRDKMMQENGKKGKSPFSEEDMAVMKRSADELAKQLPSPGLKVGEKAPEFNITNAFGKQVSLYQELKKGPVVLVFYRGAWCPFCNMHLHVLQNALPQFKKYGAQLIAVTPQKPDRSAAQIKKDAYPFEVLSDLDSSVMKSYKLYYELDPQLVSVYKKHGLDVEAFNGEGRNVLPVPGSFVIDRGGVIRAMHADIDYKNRMEPENIIAALKKL